ncbi:MAG: sulfatase-like hydrolase/transferase [Pseudomonadota bacterium]
MNLLLITADQWRGDCLSSMNHPVVKTPHLDALAAESVQFTRHFTNAVPCGPSRACLHTGMYLHNHRSGTNGTPLDRRLTNWSQVLREAGMDPLLFGYTHTGMDPRGVPEDDPGLWNDEGLLPGIRPVIDMGGFCPDWRAYLTEKGYTLPDLDAATYGMKSAPGPDPGVPAATAFSAEHSDTRFLTDRVIDTLAAHAKHKSSAPFCVHLSLRAPHPPWVAPEPYNARYPLDRLPLPVRQSTPALEREAHPWLQAHLAGPRNQSHEDLVRHRLLQASYYGLMNEVDDNLGRLVAWLKQEDLWNDTLFIFTSDHGEQMGDHWMYGKAGFFDQSYHIPLIVHGPGIKPGRVNRFTEHVDIMPTMLELFDQSVPRQCDGSSLTELLKGSAHGGRSEACYEFDFRHSPAENTLGLDMERACLNVIRDEHFKYVHFADLPPLLYDLQADPGELNNLLGSRPDVVAEYAGRLLSWRMRTVDKTLTHLQVTKDRGLVDHLQATGSNPQPG